MFGTVHLIGMFMALIYYYNTLKLNDKVNLKRLNVYEKRRFSANFWATVEEVLK